MRKLSGSSSFAGFRRSALLDGSSLNLHHLWILSVHKHEVPAEERFLSKHYGWCEKPEHPWQRLYVVLVSQSNLTTYPASLQQAPAQQGIWWYADAFPAMIYTPALNEVAAS